MSECHVMRESMPQLLVESLDPDARERTHRHIEGCAACLEEWQSMRDAWNLLEQLPAVEPPARLRERVLTGAGITAPPANIVPFHRRRPVRWLTQAAAVAILAGGSYYAGHRTAPLTIPAEPARVESVQAMPAAYSIAESRVFPATSVHPDIQGRPDIQNVQFVDADPSDGGIGISFDITSHVTVTGSPTDKSMVRLLSYVLENGSAIPSRSRAMDWVRETYSSPENADPEIARAIARVLRSEDHEGVRIKAAETLKTLPPQAVTSDGTRDALIAALKSDPNPAVRIKAVEALARMASSGAHFDAATVDTLRQKATEDNENLYVRVKAAEALSNIRPQ